MNSISTSFDEQTIGEVVVEFVQIIETGTRAFNFLGLHAYILFTLYASVCKLGLKSGMEFGLQFSVIHYTYMSCLHKLGQSDNVFSFFGE